MIKLITILMAVSFLLSCAGKRSAPVLETRAGPQRAASASLIEEGEGYLVQENWDRAAQTFQEAVNLDPTNGVGFYYLAYIKYQKGEYNRILNYLETAEALLGSNRKWKGKLEFLRNEVKSGSSRHPQ